MGTKICSSTKFDNNERDDDDEGESDGCAYRFAILSSMSLEDMAVYAIKLIANRTHV